LLKSELIWAAAHRYRVVSSRALRLPGALASGRGAPGRGASGRGAPGGWRRGG
jgi:hypothetical protein